MGIILSLCTGQVLALDEINTPWYSNTAIEGHDPVAYFSQSAAVKGDKAHKLEWKGASWHFASAKNKALFQANPEKYAPQYSGYCAWAASQNTVAGIDPDQFTIIDGDNNWPGLQANN